jgi:hypothetical protein
MMFNQQVASPPPTNAFVDPYDYQTAFPDCPAAAQSIQPI